MRSRDTTAPHLTVPFRFATSGRYVEVDEQDTPDEIRGCVYNILVTPIGHRDELPAFGAPDAAFRTFAQDYDDLQSAIEHWERRLPVALDEDPEIVDMTARRVRVLIGA